MSYKNTPKIDKKFFQLIQLFKDPPPPFPLELKYQPGMNLHKIERECLKTQFILLNSFKLSFTLLYLRNT